MSNDLAGVWEVALSDGVHRIEFEHGTTTGKRVIYIDGKVRIMILSTLDVNLERDEMHLAPHFKVSFSSKGEFLMSYLTVGDPETGLDVQTCGEGDIQCGQIKHQSDHQHRCSQWFCL